MKILFPALETRFNADAQLVKLGKRLYRGLEGEPQRDVKPSCEVSGFLTGTLDTFTDDIEVYDVVFTYFSNSREPDKCDDWLVRMIDVFDDANLASDDFSTAGCFRTDKKEPFMEDGVFRCDVEYTITIQRTTKIPATRHA